jgi:heat-inducible transcriptional repressor
MAETAAFEAEITPRQREILRHVVEEYVATGQPVGSRRVVERAAIRVSSSTVRNELAELEGRGLLTHPHTSAGRVPTDRGYRLYADELLKQLEPRPAPLDLDLSAVRSEIDTALQATTEMLSRVTRLFALVSAPPLETATVRHVEVLLLQPQVVMVVVITSTGGVTKRSLMFSATVDPGLVDWARAYLNERVVGLRLGASVLRQRFEDPGLSAAERAFLAEIRPAFTDAAGLDEQRLYVGSAAGLLADLRAGELEERQRLLEVLEQRAALLHLLREALDPRRPFVRMGQELELEPLRDVALVGVGYGLTNRTLGTVSLLGPMRMDYEKAIRSVRSAALELSRFVERVYDDN